MSYWNLSIKDAIKRNEQFRCKTPRCENTRQRLAGFCAACMATKHRTGHPQGRIYSKKYYEHEVAEAAEIIRLNRNHFLITEAISWLDRWLYNAGRGSSVLCKDWMKFNYENGYTALELFEMVCAIAMRYYRPHNPFHDFTEFKFNLAHRTLRSGKRKDSKVPRPRELRHAGKAIWEALGNAAVRVVKAADERELKLRSREKLRKVDFRIEDSE